MGNSLQDQLKNLGVANTEQVKKARTEKRKKHKNQQKHQADQVNENELRVQRAHAEKTQRDRQLNLQKKRDEEKKALAAQIKQLIEANRLFTGEEEIPYHFIVENKVKTLYVSEAIREQLGRGKLSIVRQAQRYELVPADIAEKIHQRDKSCRVELNKACSGQQDQNGDDPYAAYQVPDDLIW